MKTFTFNRKSYHYELADRGGFSEHCYYREEAEGPDLCEYIRCVGKGIVVSLLVLMLIVVVALPVVHILVGIGFSLYHGMIIFSPLAAGAMFAVALVAGAIAIMAAGKWLKNTVSKAATNMAQKEDGFVGVAYQSWKDKFCARLTFVGEKNED